MNTEERVLIRLMNSGSLSKGFKQPLYNSSGLEEFSLWNCNASVIVITQAKHFPAKICLPFFPVFFLHHTKINQYMKKPDASIFHYHLCDTLWCLKIWQIAFISLFYHKLKSLKTNQQNLEQVGKASHIDTEKHCWCTHVYNTITNLNFLTKLG